MKFIKYQSIENSYNSKRVRAVEFVADKEFVVTEKVHGANFNVTIENGVIRFGKRTGFLDEFESFFNWQSVVSKYDFSKLPDGVLYGEIFGSNVQKEIKYQDEKDLVFYDFMNPDGSFMLHSDLVSLCNDNGIRVLPALFTGTLTECLKYEAEGKKSLISTKDEEWEGVVVKPNFNSEFERVIFKIKTQSFSEKKLVKDPLAANRVAEKIIESENYEIIHSLCTDIRISSVVSKIGEVTIKDFPKVMNLYIQDVLEDAKKEANYTFNDNDKKIISNLIAKNLRNYLMNI